MQHPDEGTIHAWLDGALTPEEATRVDAHVRECAQCQAAVSEARGFIAASSRILTALDDVPRGVIPAPAMPRRSIQPWIWRIAATVLVVATGTVLLVKERGTDRAAMASRISDSTRLSAESRADIPSAIVAPSAADSASTIAAQNQPSAVTPPASVKRVPTPAASIGSASTRPEPMPTTRRNVPSAPAAPLRPSASAKQDMNAPTVGAGVTGEPRAAAVGGRTNVAVKAVAAETLPRVVGTRHFDGKTETFYEITPGDTVVLAEQSSVANESPVLTAAGVTRAQSEPTTARKSMAATESQQKAAAPPPSPVAAMQDAAVAARHSISWLDPSTRRVVVLSGQHSQEELQRIREQIQRLRDGAQRKPNPE